MHVVHHGQNSEEREFLTIVFSAGLIEIPLEMDGREDLMITE
jgi:hypothetical protein